MTGKTFALLRLPSTPCVRSSVYLMTVCFVTLLTSSLSGLISRLRGTGLPLTYSTATSYESGCPKMFTRLAIGG